MHPERAIAQFFIKKRISIHFLEPWIETNPFSTTKVSFYREEHARKTIQSVSQNLNRICWAISSYKTQFSATFVEFTEATDERGKGTMHGKASKEVCVLLQQTKTANEHSPRQ